MPIEHVSSSTILELESEPLGRVIVDGVNCRIKVGRNVTLNANLLIYNQVAGATIEIGDDCILEGVIRLVRGQGGLVRIGAQTTFNAVGISMHEAGQVLIGRDCMFSTDIHMDPSDMHPMFDRATGARLNPPQDIHIGDRVWLGTRVLVLKGARIGDGAIVGAGSIVAGSIPEHALVAGTPARVMRENVAWTREFDQAPELAAQSGLPPEMKAAAEKRRWWR